jgi:uncharacterized membrane protein (DUF106 family)
VTAGKNPWEKAGKMMKLGKLMEKAEKMMRKGWKLMEEAGKMMEKAGKIPLPMKLYFKWWTFKP